MKGLSFEGTAKNTQGLLELVLHYVDFVWTTSVLSPCGSALKSLGTAGFGVASLLVGISVPLPSCAQSQF